MGFPTTTFNKWLAGVLSFSTNAIWVTHNALLKTKVCLARNQFPEVFVVPKETVGHSSILHAVNQNYLKRPKTWKILHKRYDPVTTTK